jgi:uncharacterized lipoprotein YehR (DUF1307 family)
MKAMSKSVLPALALVALLGLAACGEETQEGAASGTGTTTEPSTGGTTGTTGSGTTTTQ